MKTRLAFFIAVFVFTLLRSQAFDAVQVTNYSYVLEGGYVVGGAGLTILAQTNLLITSLGHSFRTSGYSTARVEMVTAEGAVLRSALVSTNSPKSGTNYFEPISPIAITSGRSITLLSYGENPGASAPFDRIWIGAYILTNGIALGPGIRYVADAFIPSPYTTTNQGIFEGPTFEYSLRSTPPTLKIELIEATTIAVSWPIQPEVYFLQTAPDLRTPMTNVPEAPQTLGGDYRITFPIKQGQQYFRLSD